MTFSRKNKSISTFPKTLNAILKCSNEFVCIFVVHAMHYHSMFFLLCINFMCGLKLGQLPFCQSADDAIKFGYSFRCTSKALLRFFFQRGVIFNCGLWNAVEIESNNVTSIQQCEKRERKKERHNQMNWSIFFSHPESVHCLIKIWGTGEKSTHTHTLYATFIVNSLDFFVRSLRIRIMQSKWNLRVHCNKCGQTNSILYIETIFMLSMSELCDPIRLNSSMQQKHHATPSHTDINGIITQ